MSARAVAAVCLGGALCGCVAFESVPVAELGCDPALAGRWAPAGSDAADAIAIDNRCEAVVPGPKRSGAGAPQIRVQLRGFELDSQRYLVFDKRDIEHLMGLGAEALVDSDLQALDKQVFLMRYRIEGDTLQAAMTDQAYAADLVDEGRLPGKALAHNLSLIQADAGTVRALLLQHPDLFVSEGRGSMELVRIAAGAAR